MLPIKPLIIFLIRYVGKISSCTPSNLKLRAKIKVKFKIKIRFRVWVRVRVKDRVTVGMVLGLGCGLLPTVQWRGISRNLSDM